MQVVKKVLAYLISIYVLAIAGLYIFQERLIFQAIPLPRDYIFTFPHPFLERTYVSSDGNPLNTLFFQAKGESKGLLFYCHGNRRNLKTWGRFAPIFTELGYDVLMWDYRGFGKTPGKPTEENIFKDANFLYEEVLKEYSEEQIVLYGRSLGSGVATFLAANKSPKKLILETPYVHIADIPWKHVPIAPFDLLIKHPFRTDRYIKEVRCPIHIFHGTEDELVPYESSLELAKLLGKNPEELIVTIEGGKHRGLDKFSIYHEKLTIFLQ